MFCRFVVFSIFKNNFPNFYSAQCKYLIPSSSFSSLYSISSSSAAKIGSFISFLNTNIFDPGISIALLYPPNLCILGYQLHSCIHLIFVSLNINYSSVSTSSLYPWISITLLYPSKSLYLWISITLLYPHTSLFRHKSMTTNIKKP